MKFLILCGPSGSGKTTVRDDLSQLSKFERYHLKYFKTIQVTSRERRNNEKSEYYGENSPYIFMTEQVINSIRDESLIGVNDNRSAFGGIYGTLNIFKKNMINVIILSSEGIIDFFQKFNKFIGDDVSIYICYFELNNNEDRNGSRNIDGEKSRLLNLLFKDDLVLLNKNVKFKKVYKGTSQVTAEVVNKDLEVIISLEK